MASPDKVQPCIAKYHSQMHQVLRPLFEGEDKLSKQWAVRHRSCTQQTDVQAVQHCHEYQPGLCFFEFTDRADT